MLYCNYDSNDGLEVVPYRSKACFADVFKKLATFESIKLYILKDYSTVPHAMYSQDIVSAADNKLRFTMEEFKEYIGYLMKMGLPIDSAIREDVCHFGGRVIPKKAAWSVVVHTENTSEVASIMALNAIRYTYEEKNNAVAQTFLKLARLPHKLSLYNKFILSHYPVNAVRNHEHSIVSTSHRILSLKSQEEIDKIFHPLVRTRETRTWLSPYDYIKESIPAKFFEPLSLLGQILSAEIIDLDKALEAYNHCFELQKEFI